MTKSIKKYHILKKLIVVSVLDAHPLLSSFQLMLIEHIVMCRLIMGNKTTAIQEVGQILNWYMRGVHLR